MNITRVLIVDDSSTTRKIIQGHLYKLGFTKVTEASHGREALEKLKMNPCDLILTDWNMPEMDGLTFVKTLRQQDAYKNIPVIMVTTESARQEVVEALKEGVTDYVVKPFTLEGLRETLQRYMQIR